MKRSIAPLLVIALLVSTICTAIFYFLVAGRFTPTAEANAERAVLVAARDLPRGTSLSPGDVRTAKIAQAPSGAYSEPGELAGHVTFRDLAAGDVITADTIVTKRRGAGMSVPSGWRAVSVLAADSSGLVGTLKPGHRVDVQAVLGDQNTGELRTVVQNLEVLQVNLKPDPLPGRPPLPVVTLLASPRDADILGLADSVARVRLALRNPLDSDERERASLTVSQMMRGSKAAPGAVTLVPAAAVRRSDPAAGRTATAAAGSGSGLSLGTSAPAAGCVNPGAK